MDNIKIINNIELSSQAANILLEALQNDPITKNIIDLSKTKSRDTFLKVMDLKIKLYMDYQQPVFIAVKNREVVGVALLKKSGFSIPFKEIKKNISNISLMFSLFKAVEIKKLLALRKLIKKPQDLMETYYLLEMIAVKPEAQAKGVGRFLLNQIHSFTERNKDIKGIYLYTATEKNKLIFANHGYEIIELKQNKELSVYHMLREKRT